jgi:Uma2 family endonuclease
MSTLTIELPSQRTQTAFNLKRWAELLTDSELAKIEGRIETDRYGHIIMSPPAAASHGGFQSAISAILWRLMPTGEVFTECPISTADGVRSADIAWASPECVSGLGDLVCFPRAPEICIEVISPSNTRRELKEKVALYFDAGAKEVWFCDKDGTMEYYVESATLKSMTSRLCPEFPARVRGGR